MGAGGRIAMDGEWVQRLVEAAWDFWWGLGDLRERLDPWSEAGPLLARLAPGKVLELAKRLRDKDWRVRYAAAQALGAMGPAAATPEVLQALLACLRDEDGEVRWAAAEALGQMGPAAATPEVLQALMGCLRDEDGSVRAAAAGALGAMGPAAATPEVLQALLERLQDEDRHVRRAAAEALTAWHRQGLRLFRDAQGRWTVRTVEELSALPKR
jgi:HEAT repeat protein